MPTAKPKPKSNPGDLEGVKGPLESTTIWGLIIVFISLVALAILILWLQLDISTLAEVIALLTGLVGTIVALYGRMSASKKVDF